MKKNGSLTFLEVTAFLLKTFEYSRVECNIFDYFLSLTIHIKIGLLTDIPVFYAL